MSLAYDNPTTLAEFSSLAGDSDVNRKVLIDTVRDYMPFFDQGLVVAANDGTTDKGKIITAYPEGQLRGYNEGWNAEVATGMDVRYEAAMIRTRSVVDVDLYEQRGAEGDAWRLRKDQAFMRGLARSAVRRVFYGDKGANARDFNGLANLVVPGHEAFGERVIDAKGTTAAGQASIWLINWDADGAYMFYPQHGSQAGLSFEDMGRQYVADKNGKDYMALVSEFKWDLGMALYNPESIVRIANVDVAKLSKNAASGADLVDLMAQALEMLPDAQTGRVAFYMNDNIRSVLRRQMMNRDNLMLNWSEVAGRKVLAFGDVPVHKLGSDVLANNEAVLK
jgi:hypothetical protein